MTEKSSESESKNKIETEEPLRSTGTKAISKKHSKYYFTTQDLVIIAILGVMGGFISGLVPFNLLVKTWYPFVGGTQLVSGHHILWMVLAYGCTRKKPAILLTATIKALVMFLLGGEWGIVELPISLYEGTFTILGFMLVEKFKEGETNFGWGLAAGLGNLSQVPLFWIMTGKMYILHYSLFIMAMMFAFLSGILMAGILGRIIVVRLEKAGVI